MCLGSFLGPRTLRVWFLWNCDSRAMPCSQSDHALMADRKPNLFLVLRGKCTLQCRALCLSMGSLRRVDLAMIPCFQCFIQGAHRSTVSIAISRYTSTCCSLHRHHPLAGQTLLPSRLLKPMWQGRRQCCYRVWSVMVAVSVSAGMLRDVRRRCFTFISYCMQI